MSTSYDDSTNLEDDSADYLISVSDMMSGLLFIFIITLMTFVYNFQLAEQQAQLEQVQLKQAEEHAQNELVRLERRNELLDNTRKIQREMLEEIKNELSRRGIQVVVVENQGVLRLSENAIEFQSGRASLNSSERDKLIEIGSVLAIVLPCYTATPPTSLECSDEAEGKLESVFIEGHTDNQPVGTNSPFEDNWDLSAKRAITAYHVLQNSVTQLMELNNIVGDPLFSVSGYGAGRPINEHAEPTPDSGNRRIDLRFIMVSPLQGRSPIQAELEARGVK